MEFCDDDNILVVAGQSSGAIAAMTIGQGGAVTEVHPLLLEKALVTPTTVVVATV